MIAKLGIVGIGFDTELTMGVGSASVVATKIADSLL